MIVAIDIGTTSAKAALFERDGTCLGVGREAIRGIIGSNPIEHEIDPRSWTEAMRKLFAALSALAPVGLNDVECVVVSGNGPTLLPVDGEGEPLHNAITWMDRRAAEESELAEPILGRSLDPAYNLPKVLWMRAHRPDLYERTRWFSSCPEFLMARLCGNWISILPAEGYQAILWDAASLRLLNLDERKFPPFAALGSIVGKVTRKASKRRTSSRNSRRRCGPDFIVSLIGRPPQSPAGPVTARPRLRVSTSAGRGGTEGSPASFMHILLLLMKIYRAHLRYRGQFRGSWRGGRRTDDHDDFSDGRQGPGGGRNLLPYLRVRGRRCGIRCPRRIRRPSLCAWPG